MTKTKEPVKLKTYAELSDLQKLRVERDRPSAFKVFMSNDLFKKVENKTWEEKFYKSKMNWWVDYINDYLAIYDLEVSLFLFNEFPKTIENVVEIKLPTKTTNKGKR
jgi:hypothetical protein